MYAMEQIAEIAARIRELREACGYTQEELAKKLGIDVAVLRAYEENGYNIPISVIYPVSYTHLDVYKRQTVCFAGGRQSGGSKHRFFSAAWNIGRQCQQFF